MSSNSSTDRIEKQVRLNNPRSRVWRALTNAGEFGKWFGVNFQGAFTPGAAISGKLTIKGYEHVTLEIIIDAMEPERMFSFRWRPYAIDPSVDYSSEPRTLVVFTLQEAESGTVLTVVETGFDGIPAHRRAKAFEMNTSGWTGQMKNIEKYLAANG